MKGMLVHVYLYMLYIKISCYWRGKLFYESLYLYNFFINNTTVQTNQMQILKDHGHVVAPIFFSMEFYDVIIGKWSFHAHFPIIPIVKLPFLYHDSFIKHSIPMDPKRVIKGLHCTTFTMELFLQRNFRKMTMEWSFSYNFFVKLSFYTTIHL